VDCSNTSKFEGLKARIPAHSRFLLLASREIDRRGVVVGESRRASLEEPQNGHKIIGVQTVSEKAPGSFLPVVEGLSKQGPELFPARTLWENAIKSDEGQKKLADVSSTRGLERGLEPVIAKTIAIPNMVLCSPESSAIDPVARFFAKLCCLPVADLDLSPRKKKKDAEAGGDAGPDQYNLLRMLVENNAPASFFSVDVVWASFLQKSVRGVSS